MVTDYYADFFVDKPELVATFNKFGERYNIPVAKKLKSIKDRDEFLAEIIEYRFGVLFGALFENVEHERKVFPGSPFTPDWTITSGSQLVVAEVIRLNPSQGDSLEMKLTDALMNSLNTILGDYLVQLKYNYEEIKDLPIDQEYFKSQVREWILTDPSIGSYMTFNSKINVVVKKKNVGLTKVNAISSFRRINFDYRRLTGENSRLFSKLKYAGAVNKHELPYIICMHLSFESWFKPEDMYEKLYGPSAVFEADRPFKEFYPGAEFHTFADGLYYSNETIKNCVSGIIIYYHQGFTFFPNYCCTNRLSGDSIRRLNNFLYKDLKI